MNSLYNLELTLQISPSLVHFPMLTLEPLTNPHFGSCCRNRWYNSSSKPELLGRRRQWQCRSCCDDCGSCRCNHSYPSRFHSCSSQCTYPCHCPFHSQQRGQSGSGGPENRLARIKHPFCKAGSFGGRHQYQLKRVQYRQWLLSEPVHLHLQRECIYCK